MIFNHETGVDGTVDITYTGHTGNDICGPIYKISYDKLRIILG